MCETQITQEREDEHTVHSGEGHHCVYSQRALSGSDPKDGQYFFLF